MITDSIAKEMMGEVDERLSARQGSVTIFHTDRIPLAIVTALMLDVAQLDAGGTLPDLNRLQDLRQRFGYEYTLTRFLPESDSWEIGEA